MVDSTLKCNSEFVLAPEERNVYSDQDPLDNSLH